MDKPKRNRVYPKFLKELSLYEDFLVVLARKRYGATLALRSLRGRRYGYYFSNTGRRKSELGGEDKRTYLKREKEKEGEIEKKEETM